MWSASPVAAGGEVVEYGCGPGVNPHVKVQVSDNEATRPFLMDVALTDEAGATERMGSITRTSRHAVAWAWDVRRRVLDVCGHIQSHVCGCRFGGKCVPSARWGAGDHDAERYLGWSHTLSNLIGEGVRGVRRLTGRGLGG